MGFRRKNYEKERMKKIFRALYWLQEDKAGEKKKKKREEIEERASAELKRERERGERGERRRETRRSKYVEHGNGNQSSDVETEEHPGGSDDGGEGTSRESPV